MPKFTYSEIHIVAGLLLPNWNRLPDESSRVYRLQTDAGDPSFTAPTYANLFEDEDGDVYILIWSCPTKRNGE